MFGLLGISLYKGKFGYCENETNFLIGIEDCKKLKKQWINHIFNFDSIGNALYTLLIITTFDGWKPILYIASNSNNISEVTLFQLQFFFLSNIINFLNLLNAIFLLIILK